MRRFWLLKRNNSNNIVICGSPSELPSYDKDYAIIPLNDKCNVPNAKVRRNSSDGKLYLVTHSLDTFDFNKVLVPATGTNILEPDCAGMAELGNYEREYYVGEMSNGSYAETAINTGFHTSLTILPWSGKFTGLAASRELGKTVGLGYMYMDLPRIGDDNINSEQNNIMLFHLQLGGHKLRQRNVPVMDSLTGMGYENQWNCLQRISPEQSCSHQDWLFE